MVFQFNFKFFLLSGSFKQHNFLKSLFFIPMDLMISLVIQDLFSVFFLLLKIFEKWAQKFISLSTLLINSSEDKLILLPSKCSSDCQFTFSRSQDIIVLLFLHLESHGIANILFSFREIRLIFHY